MLDRLTIHEPRTVVEASAMLTEFGTDATIYAGGTELLVVMKERLIHYPHLVNIKTVPGLDEISVDGDSCSIGALATHRVIERSPIVRQYLPLLAELEANVANVRVRSTGTIGGNLCFAEPHSDPATLLMAWDASVVLESTAGRRDVPLSDFFTGLLETDRRQDEIMTSIRIPLPVPAGSAYERFKIHERPTVTVAVTLTMNGDTVADARIVIGSVCDRPTRVLAAEQCVIGQVPSIAAASAAAIVHDTIEPTEDKFESTDYKRHLAKVLTTRAIGVAAVRASGGHRG